MTLGWLMPNSHMATMKPRARDVAHSRLSTKRMMPDMVSPLIMSRMALVMGMPGMSSMITPMVTMPGDMASTRRDATAISTPETRDAMKLNTMVLAISGRSRSMRKHTNTANRADMAASTQDPPKKMAKRAAPRTPPA